VPPYQLRNTVSKSYHQIQVRGVQVIKEREKRFHPKMHNASHWHVASLQGVYLEN
jgi:hypothetical protein